MSYVIPHLVNYVGNHWSIGNHFFEFATAYAFAKKTGRELVLPRKNIEVPAEDFVYHGWYAGMAKWVGDMKVGSLAMYKEPAFAYKQIPNGPYTTVILYGYFQSSKYFADCRADLLEILQPEQEIKDLTQARWGFLLNNVTESMVLVHARRTDYLKAAAIHNPLPPLYYENAFQEIKKHVKNPIFILVSDEPDYWKTVHIPGSYMVVDESDARVSLHFMTHFKNYIIANSTFSWWSAYLSKAEGKRVLAPEIWFGPEGFPDYQDIYEDGWIKVSQV